ncbi:MAG: LPS assembly lipoprotein LptE [Brevundimonas sp.]|jgi:LPS-assembly lipoprotein|uniref:LPS assembly lipoprotein LptE n=1 Tax=Brevundimonas sp. TaxID=1871086 RepID=UPI0027201F06|nr:LPS assembly lipoprotein LptE [Brevundimonas sp.]MDO9607698.1 LPS assembly lipoprotein LptE [Brevundimonas sp.]
MRGAAVIAVIGALAVSACGFTPMYAEPAVGSPLRRIAVSAQDDRLGYRLREQLEDALGWDRSATPLYRLTTQVEQERRSLGRRIDDTATRYELTVKASWTLTPAAGGTPATGVQTVTTTYAAADQPYAAIAAQQDGEERAASELARRIRLDLMQALSNQ